jgi:hypothetical protein
MRSAREPGRDGQPASVRGYAVGGPDWLDGEAERAEKLRDGGQTVNNPSASPPPPRSLKGFRMRQDYQRRYDLLAATVKHTQDKKGPELVEEALEMLFDRHAEELS